MMDSIQMLVQLIGGLGLFLYGMKLMEWIRKCRQGMSLKV